MTLNEFRNLTWGEFEFLERGYEIRYEKQLEIMRNQMAATINGYAKSTINPKGLIRLPYIDRSTKSVSEVKKVSDELIRKAMQSWQES